MLSVFVVTKNTVISVFGYVLYLFYESMTSWQWQSSYGKSDVCHF